MIARIQPTVEAPRRPDRRTRPTARRSEQLPQLPPGEWLEALFGMVDGRAQDQAGIDEHLRAGQIRKAAVEDQMLAEAGAGPQIASEAIGIRAVETQTVEGRGSRGLR